MTRPQRSKPLWVLPIVLVLRPRQLKNPKATSFLVKFSRKDKRQPCQDPSHTREPFLNPCFIKLCCSTYSLLCAHVILRLHKIRTSLPSFNNTSQVVKYFHRPPAHQHTHTRAHAESTSLSVQSLLSFFFLALALKAVVGPQRSLAILCIETGYTETSDVAFSPSLLLF